MDFLTTLAIMGPLSVAAVFIARITMNRDKSTKKQLSQLKADYVSIIDAKIEIINELKNDLQRYKNKASNMERGPAIEGEMGELPQLLPELISQFEPMAPKWLKPLLGNKETQQWIAKYVEEHPEKAQEWFAKLIRPKNSTGSPPEIADAL